MATKEYKKPKVKLTGTDGNSFALMGKIQQAMKRAGASAELVKEFFAKATSGDYNHLLRTCIEYADVT